MTGPERRLSAIMFADMVGYTALGQRNESLSLALVEEERKLIRPILTRHNGREVKTIGDALLVQFPSALEAVRCAYDIQRAAREFNISLPEERRIHLRIGVHIGDVVESQGDISGDAVNLASRVEPLAEDGGVCLTRQVYDQVQNKFQLPLTSLGSRKLKNVIVPVDVYKMVMPWHEEKTAEPSLDRNRVAVLPFANISPENRDEYFADGMTEELISTLSRINGLRVIARTSIARYKGTTKPVAEIRRELGVNTILEGSVRKAGNRIRVTAQLIDASTEEHVWSQEYDRNLADVFSIQSDIAKRIAKALKIRIRQSESLQIEKKATSMPEAYSLYLKGRQSSNARTEVGLKAAVEHFEHAIMIDEGFALAYTGLADAYAILALLELVPPREAFPKAMAAVETGLSLDDNLAEAHVSLGIIWFQYEWDWPHAEAEFKRALELNPGYAPAHQYYADYLKAMGRFDEALSEVEEARSLDPLSLAINTAVGHVLYLSRQYDRAIEQYRKAVELDPAFIPARLWFGRPYMQKGMFREAVEQLTEAVSLSGESTISLAMLGQAYASAGQHSEAKMILQRLLDRSKKQYVPSYWIALVYMSMGNKDEAFAWLERAYNERSSWLVWMNVEPRFDTLRDDPRYTSIVSRMR